MLLSLLTEDPADLHLARRRTGYDHLVLVCHPGMEAVARRHHAHEVQAAGVDAAKVIDLKGDDFDESRHALGALVSDLSRKSDVTLNAAGGTPILLMAALIVAFDHGIPTVFSQAGHLSKLPVLRRVRLLDRFDDVEKRILRALPPEGAFAHTLAELTLQPKDKIQRGLRGLEGKGLVALDAKQARSWAAWTPSGLALVEHLRGAAQEHATPRGRPRTH